MLRVTDDIMEVRRWAEAHGASPCRDDATGRLRLAFPGDPCTVEVGWEEFEPAFCAGRCVLVYDDAPGTSRAFVGGIDEAEAFVGRETGARPQA